MTKRQKSTFGATTVLVLVLVVVLINVALIYCYRRYTKREIQREMQVQVSAMMTQYLAIVDAKEQHRLNLPQ